MTHLLQSSKYIIWRTRNGWKMATATAHTTLIVIFTWLMLDAFLSFFFPLGKDAARETIPIMLVGNKADLRDSASAEGQKCISGYFGEKLAMVSMRVSLNWQGLQEHNWLAIELPIEAITLL